MEKEIYLTIKIICRESRCPDGMTEMHTRCVFCKYKDYHYKRITKKQFDNNGKYMWK
jgi:hypothetical protein